jgi:lipopolysaccharide transport system ATP-binding protein
MSETVIRVENLGKKYIIGHQSEGAYQYTALRDVIAGGVKAIGQKLRRPTQTLSQTRKEEFWALKDVSFEVKRGEVIGIIGRNGAGKSTLLKILSRITEPTTGRIQIKGRVASLLEVGTGFHPELTGRENIFLNGAILGMSRAEINRKFDEIVEFAEITRFLDTPVKRYSSGMYVRLAFAVAAHLEPEILVVDEVLAVGDIAFQKKCLGKIKSVSQQDRRTVLFVSHNIAAIQNICKRGMILSGGRLAKQGLIEDVVYKYMSSHHTIDTEKSGVKIPWTTDQKVQIIGIRILDEHGNPVENCQTGDLLRIELQVKSPAYKTKADFNIGIYNQLGEKLTHIGTAYSQTKTPTESINIKEIYKVVCNIPDIPLPEGLYYLNFSVFQNSEKVQHIRNGISLYVSAGDFYNTGKLPPTREMKFLMKHIWVIC